MNTVKSFKSPSQPRTSRQLTIRGFMLTSVRAWAALTPTHRTGWNDFSVAHPETDWTSGSKRLTGANWYCRLSVRLLDLAKSVVATAPVAAAPPGIVLGVATGGSGQISVAYTAHGGTADQIDIWTEGPMSAGRLAKIERAKHRQYGPAETTPIVVTGLTPGLHTVFARCISETDGQASSFTSTTATVT